LPKVYLVLDFLDSKNYLDYYKYVQIFYSTVIPEAKVKRCYFKTPAKILEC
jgi:hypothetical protein